MTLPFRYQFVIAPVVIVVLLVALVIYTLLELNNINQHNAESRHWEILTDQMQSSIATAAHLRRIIGSRKSIQELEEEEQFFAYLEQSRILADILSETNLIKHVTPTLRAELAINEKIFRQAESYSPVEIGIKIEELLPQLEYQTKIFTAQRRTATINNHRQLIDISSRMTTILLSSLLLCILLSIGLAVWGLKVIRRRLHGLAERANLVCSGSVSGQEKTPRFHDELIELESCLANITRKLLNVVSMENTFRGAEQERRRIAMDMHDGILAELTGINRDINTLETQHAEDELYLKQLEKLRKDIDEAIRQLRRVIDDLHPQVLETLGLEAALLSFLRRHVEQPGSARFHFDFEAVLDSILSDEEKLNLFRIVSEAVNNVLKHSRAEQFEVILRLVNDSLLVNVEDNATGMNPASVHRGYGINNIEERARFIGASVTWNPSRFATGTCLKLELPLQQRGLKHNA